MSSYRSRPLSSHNELVDRNIVEGIITSKNVDGRGVPEFRIEIDGAKIYYYFNVTFYDDIETINILLEDANMKKLREFSDVLSFIKAFPKQHPTNKNLVLIATGGVAHTKSVYTYVIENSKFVVDSKVISDRIFEEYTIPKLIQSLSNISPNTIDRLISSIAHYGDMNELDKKQLDRLIKGDENRLSIFNDFVLNYVKPISRMLDEIADDKCKLISFKYNGESLHVNIDYETKNEYIIFNNRFKVDIDELMKVAYIISKGIAKKRVVFYNLVNDTLTEFHFEGIAIEADYSRQFVDMIGKEIYIDRRWRKVNYDDKEDIFTVFIGSGSNAYEREVTKGEIMELIRNNKVR